MFGAGGSVAGPAAGAVAVVSTAAASLAAVSVAAAVGAAASVTVDDIGDATGSVLSAIAAADNSRLARPMR
jgi:hypothetical protein